MGLWQRALHTPCPGPFFWAPVTSGFLSLVSVLETESQGDGLHKVSPMSLLQKPDLWSFISWTSFQLRIRDLKRLMSITYLTNVVKEQTRCISVSCSRNKATTERRQDGQFREGQRAVSEIHSRQDTWRWPKTYSHLTSCSVTLPCWPRFSKALGDLSSLEANFLSVNLFWNRTVSSCGLKGFSCISLILRYVRLLL